MELQKPSITEACCSTFVQCEPAEWRVVGGETKFPIALPEHLQRFGFHDCRHHFISYAVMSGIDYMTIVGVSETQGYAFRIVCA